MGAVGGMLGLAGGANGTGISGPSQANISNPVTQAQIGTAYNGAQNSLQSQQALLTSLQGQNALANQNQVYGQLQGVANGTGPNPAQTMLNQSTGQNVANQAALMAGQRGAGANVGLMARQAAQTGAATQQNAVGQAATMQANQSLNAINAAGNMANTQASNLIAGTGANTQAQMGEQQSLLNAQAAYNNAQVGSQTSVNSANGMLANGVMSAQQGAIGGLFGGAGSAMGMASGGMVEAPKMMADGGDPSAVNSSGQSSFSQALGQQSQGAFANMGSSGGGQSELNKGMNSFASGLGDQIAYTLMPGPSTGPSTGNFTSGGDYTQGAQNAINAGQNPNSPNSKPGGFAKGGKVPALVSPGETYLPPKKAESVVENGKNPLKEGKKIPGKPKYPGNDYRNDTVPATLQEGGVVIPNEIMQSDDPAKHAANFVAATLAHNKYKVRK